MLRLVWQVVYLGFLQLCSGQDFPCNVTQVASQTLYNYSVPKFSATNCDYQWTNSTDYVLANQKGKKDELVVMKSSRTLLTNECFKLILYKRNCISEGTLREVNCTTNCIGNVGPQSGGGISHNHSIAVPVVIILLLVGLFLF